MIRVYAARAILIDGSVSDLLLFTDRESAVAYVSRMKRHCQQLGWDAIDVHERVVIGRGTLSDV